MKRYYFQTYSQDYGINLLIIRHKTVKTMKDAIERFHKIFAVPSHDILEITTKRPEFEIKEESSESVIQLLNYVNILQNRRKEELTIG